MSQIKMCLKFISNVWLQDHAAYFLVPARKAVPLTH
jgi:hypothetical protein